MKKDTVLTNILIPFVQSMVSECLFISMLLNYICRSNVTVVNANMATTEPDMEGAILENISKQLRGIKIPAIETQIYSHYARLC